MIQSYQILGCHHLWDCTFKCLQHVLCCSLLWKRKQEADFRSEATSPPVTLFVIERQIKTRILLGFSEGGCFCRSVACKTSDRDRQLHDYCHFWFQVKGQQLELWFSPMVAVETLKHLRASVSTCAVLNPPQRASHSSRCVFSNECTGFCLLGMSLTSHILIRWCILCLWNDGSFKKGALWSCMSVYTCSWNSQGQSQKVGKHLL